MPVKFWFSVAALNGFLVAPYMALPFSMPVRIAVMIAVNVVPFILKSDFLDLLRTYVIPAGLYIYGCFRFYGSPISPVTIEFFIGLLGYVVALWLNHKYRHYIEAFEATEDDVDYEGEDEDDEDDEDDEYDEDDADEEVVYEADAEVVWDETDEEEPEANTVKALGSGDEGEAWEEEQAYRFRTEEAKAFFMESTEPKQTGTGNSGGGDPAYGTYHGFQSEASEKFFVEWARRVADDVEHKNDLADDEDDWSLFESDEKSAPVKNKTAVTAQNANKKKKKKSNKKKKRH